MSKYRRNAEKSCEQTKTFQKSKESKKHAIKVTTGVKAIILSKISQKDKNKCCIIYIIYGI